MTIVYLSGSKEVQRAGSQMASAASEMQRAALSIQYALEQHQQFMNDWLDRLNGTLEDRISDYRQAQS